MHSDAQSLVYPFQNQLNLLGHPNSYGMPSCSKPARIHSRIFVPSMVVGALIGVKGSNIKNMIFATGASIKIGPDAKKKSDGAKVATEKAEDKGQGDATVSRNVAQKENTAIDKDVSSPESAKSAKKILSEDLQQPKSHDANIVKEEKTVAENSLATAVEFSDPEVPESRFVIISGYDFQVFKAQSWIFQRIAECTNNPPDQLVLTTETVVPSKIVGRIIGKKGKNVRELRHATHALVHVINDDADVKKLNEAVTSSPKNAARRETCVRITGNLMSLQSCQSHLLMLVAEAEQKELCNQSFFNISAYAQSCYYPQFNMFAHPSSYGMPSYSSPCRIKSRVFVPSSVVGALIGVKGSNIKNMIFATGASIKIGPDAKKKSDGAKVATEKAEDKGQGDATVTLNMAQKENTEIDKDVSTPESAKSAKKLVSEDLQHPKSHDENIIKESLVTALEFSDPEVPESRFVIISGYDFQVFKAQSWIFQRIAECTNNPADQLVLTAETVVPSKIVGRIIGKKGKNVRELRQATHALVHVINDDADVKKVNEDPTSPPKNAARRETCVRITGNLMSLQSCQSHLLMLIAEAEQKERDVRCSS